MFHKPLLFSVLFFSVLSVFDISGVLQAGTYEGPFIVRIIDAQNKEPVVGALITFSGQKGKTISGSSDEMGWVQIDRFPFTEEDDQEGRIGFTVSAEGYSQLIDKSPVYQKRLMMSRKNLAQESIRIVLSWGKYPRDLDGHLYFDDHHVYWNAKNKHWSAYQDVDHRWSFGPETITINRVLDATRYTYIVHDYSNRHIQGTSLAESDARVQIYKGKDSQLVNTFYISPDQPGNVWYVFEIGPTKKLNEINRVDFVDYNNW